MICTVQNYALIFLMFAVVTTVVTTLILSEIDSRRFRRRLEKDALDFTAALKEFAKEDFKKRKAKV